MKAVVISLLLCAAPLFGQDLTALMQQNMMFGQQMNANVQNMMMQLQAQRQALLQNYIRSNYQQLQRDYGSYVQTTGQQLPFEYFAYIHMATAGGTNAAPALRQQQEGFQAQQNAIRGMQQGFDDYNRGWHANQARQEQAIERYDRGAVRGNALYGDSNGNTYELQYGGSRNGYLDGTNAIASDDSGTYRRYDPSGFSEELEQLE